MSAIVYGSRKEQLRAFQRELKLKLTPAEKRRLSNAMRDAAMVGAAEERNRTLKILADLCADRTIAHRIVAVSVLAVLGYEA